MSKMMDYIVGKADGPEALLEAQVEHMGGYLSAEIEENQKLRKALEAAAGYLTNARIDLTTGCPKATAVQTIDGGLKMIRETLAHPAVQSPPQIVQETKP